jgi:hypothetical protein
MGRELSRLYLADLFDLGGHRPQWRIGPPGSPPSADVLEQAPEDRDRVIETHLKRLLFCFRSLQRPQWSDSTKEQS